MAIQHFQFRDAAHVHRAIKRWCSLSKRQRCDAICKQHGFSDATQIWDCDSRGKCRSEAAFVGECDGVMVTFDYWGLAMIGYWQLDAGCDVSVVAEALADPQCTEPEHQN